MMCLGSNMSRCLKDKSQYVVSEDIHIFLGRWATKEGFRIPDEHFFTQLRKDMKSALGDIWCIENVDMISLEKTRRNIAKCITTSKIPVISMDLSCPSPYGNIHVARSVDQSLNEIGLRSRFGYPSFEEQLAMIAKKYKEVILIDDVLFSGGMMTDVVERLNRLGTRVSHVVVSIAIGEGWKRVLRETGIKVSPHVYYERVLDEICERDFYPGVPYSGRLVSGLDVDTGAPYIAPFGKPFEWASIPKSKENDFSYFCLQQSIRLWEEIEKKSGRNILSRDLWRVPIGVKKDSLRFVDVLKGFGEIALLKKDHSVTVGEMCEGGLCNGKSSHLE